MQTIKPTRKPTKQRKMLFQAPDHIRYKHFAALLSPDLRAQHGVRALPIRSGDTVRVMRGDHKGFEGKVNRVERQKYRIYVEGLSREKVDGTTILVPVHPSKVMIINLDLADKWRKQVLQRKKTRRIIEEIKEKPPSEEVVKEKEAVKARLPQVKPKKRKKKVVEKPAEKKLEERPKKRKKVKTASRKKTKETRKKEKPRVKKARAKRKAMKKTNGGK